MKKLAFRVWTSWQNLKHRDEGQGMVEYALIIGLVAIAAIVILGTMSGDLNGIFGNISNTLSNVIQG